MRIGKMTITPAKAEKWLEKNFEYNRRLKPGLVNKIAADIQAGRWHLTGDLIRFNTMGFLIDGQHRLNAVLKADQSIESYVAFDVPDEAKKVIDTGISRTAADILTMDGIGDNVHQKVALARRIIAWKKKKNTVVIGRQFMSACTNQDILEFVSHYDLKPHLSFGWKVYSVCVNTRLLSQTDWAMLHYILSEKDKAQAEKFLQLFASLDGLMSDHPIRILFNKLNKSQVDISASMKFKFIIKTWNTWRTGGTELKLSVLDLEAPIPELV